MKMLSPWSAIAAALALVLVAGPAVAQNHIANPSFEDPALAPGNATLNTIPGWSGLTVGCCGYGVSYEIGQLPTPYGDQWGYTNGGTAAIAQQTAKTVVAQEAYTASAAFGQRTDNPANSPTLELWAGGTVVDGDVIGGTLVASQAVATAAGVFTMGTVTWVAPVGSPLIGQPLTVRLSNVGGAQTNYDNVSLLAVNTVPTLSEWGMILFGLILAGGSAWLVQRRQLV